MTIEASYERKPEYIINDGAVNKFDVNYVGRCLAEKYGVKSDMQKQDPKKGNALTDLGAMLLEGLVVQGKQVA